MSKIAQTPAMRHVRVDGDGWFKARERGTPQILSARAIICGNVLRDHFCLPQDVSEIWLIAYDSPTACSLKVVLEYRRPVWVSCAIGSNELEFFTWVMDRYLVKHLGLKDNKQQTFQIECEYRE